MFLDFIDLAVRNILHRKRRSWLTIIGIFIGIAAVVALVSLGQGLQDSVEAEFESIGGDKVFINPGGSQTSGRFAESSSSLDEDDRRAVGNTRGVDQTAGALFRQTRATHRGESSFISLVGLPTADETQEIVRTSWAIEIEDGRFLRDTDTSNIVIGSRAATDLFDEDLSIRSQITIDGESYRVVGILKPTGDPAIDSAVFTPLDQAREIVGVEDDFDWIFARVQEGFTPEEVKEDVERSLRQERDLEKGEEDFTVSTPQDLISSFQSILNLVRGVVVGIASISLLVGGVGIMNTMYTSVTERTREIGVMKAVGATNRQILLLFILESGMIGLGGGLLGLIVGLGLSQVAAIFATQATSITIQPSFAPALIFGALFFSFLVGTISGVMPAKRAANLQPADALRYE